MTIITDDEYTQDDLTRDTLAWAASQFVTERQPGEITIAEFAQYIGMSQETARTRLATLVKRGQMIGRKARVEGTEVWVYRRREEGGTD